MFLMLAVVLLMIQSTTAEFDVTFVFNASHFIHVSAKPEGAANYSHIQAVTPNENSRFILRSQTENDTAGYQIYMDRNGSEYEWKLHAVDPVKGLSSSFNLSALGVDVLLDMNITCSADRYGEKCNRFCDYTYEMICDGLIFNVDKSLFDAAIFAWGVVFVSLIILFSVCLTHWLNREKEPAQNVGEFYELSNFNRRTGRFVTVDLE